MSGPGLYERIALRRVDDGGVTTVAGAYLDRGRRTPDYLGDVFDRLVWTGWVTVAEGDTRWERRRLTLTDAGQARYAELAEQGGQHREMSPPDVRPRPSVRHEDPGRPPVERPSSYSSRRPVGHQVMITPGMWWGRDGES